MNQADHTMHQVERWVNNIFMDLPPLTLGRAVMLNTSSSEFYDLAKFIVEPEMPVDGDLTAYAEFIENNIDGWVSWITQTIGEQWGHIAKVISVEGY